MDFLVAHGLLSSTKTIVNNKLYPVSVGNETEEEVIVVEADLGNDRVRFINGYGPQEDDEEEKRLIYFSNQL